MTSIWKYHCDRLRKAAKEYVEAVHAYCVEADGARSADAAGAEAEMEAAEQAIDVALTLCDAQDAVDAAGKGGAR